MKSKASTTNYTRMVDGEEYTVVDYKEYWDRARVDQGGLPSGFAPSEAV